jgi:hypothetical protein
VAGREEEHSLAQCTVKHVIGVIERRPEIVVLLEIENITVEIEKLAMSR